MMEQVEAMPFADLMALASNPLSLNFERWSFQIVVNKLDSDLASIEILAWVTAQQSGHVRLVTLKSRKQEAF